MSLATKTKNVSNTSLMVSTILNIIEQEELDFNKLQSLGMKIDKFLYDMDRQIKKKGQDEYYQLDISSKDLQSIAEAAEKHIAKLRNKCTYRSMKKSIDKMAIDGKIPAEPYIEWRKGIPPLFYVCGLLQRLLCVTSYQSIVLDILEAEDNAYEMGNVLFSAIKDEIKKGPNVW